MGSVNAKPMVDAYKAEPNKLNAQQAVATTKPGAVSSASTTPNKVTMQGGPTTDTFTPSNNLFVGSLDIAEKKAANNSTDKTTNPIPTEKTGTQNADNKSRFAVNGTMSPSVSLAAETQQEGNGLFVPNANGDGDGTNILVIDDYKSNGTPHGEMVVDTLKQFSPDADVHKYHIEADGNAVVSTSRGEIPRISGNSLDLYIDQLAGIPELGVEVLKKGLASDPDAKVVNMSFGASRQDAYEGIYANLAKGNADSLAEKLGLTPDQVKNLKPNGTDATVEKAIASYVDKRLDDPDSEYSKNLSDYQAYTKELAEKGISVVVSAGNAHGESPRTYPGSSPDKEFNILAMSDYVISVAASTDNDKNGKIADFSSRGGGKWKPTLAADGTDINAAGDIVDGTSFSAPTVSGVIGEILERNPNMSFKDIKSHLTSSKSVYDTDATDEEEGAGILNVKGAINGTGGQNFDPTKAIDTILKTNALDTLLKDGNFAKLATAEDGNDSLDLKEAQNWLAYLNKNPEGKRTPWPGSGYQPMVDALTWLTTDGHYEQVAGPDNTITLDDLKKALEGPDNPFEVIIGGPFP